MLLQPVQSALGRSHQILHGRIAGAHFRQNRSAQNRSSCSSRHNRPANQQAPHCRGRCRRISEIRSRTTEASSTATSQRSSGNKASVRVLHASASNTSIALRHPSACDELISPKQNVPLHHPAAVETLVLDDAPIEVRLAVLPSLDSPQEHDGACQITEFLINLSWSSLQAFLEPSGIARI